MGLKNVVMDQLNENLAIAPWSVREIFDSPDDQYEFWFALFQSALEEYAPRKKMRLRDKDTNEWERKYTSKYTTISSPGLFP